MTVSFKQGRHSGFCRMVAYFGVLALGLASIPGCGGGGSDGPPPTPPPPNLSGVWAGNWSGSDPVEGQVSGNWEAEIVQTEAGVSGMALISGDVDCSEGAIAGQVGSDNIPRGSLDRAPCERNDWRLTSLIADGMKATGAWEQAATGASGQLSGRRIATSNGPRVRFFSPPGGPPGAYLTLVGERLAANAGDNLVTFPGVNAVAAELVVPGVLSLRVPDGAGMGALHLATPGGAADSPRTFNASPGFPNPVVSASYQVGAVQRGLAVSRDGRRLYLALDNGSLSQFSVAMLDAADGALLATTDMGGETAQGLALSPDGGRLYACNGSLGVRVLHATTNTLLETYPVACGDGTVASPRGLAVTPDGGLLLVADSVAGGDMVLLDLPDGLELDRYSPGVDYTPVAVAASPDDLRAFMLFDSAAGPGLLVIYELADGSITASIPVGAGPVGLAVTPDAARVFVSNRDDGSISIIDTASLSVSATLQVSELPAGLAVSPDGSRLYVAGGGSDLLEVYDAGSGKKLAGTQLFGQPLAIAIGPGGKNAYVAHLVSHVVAHLGGTRSLTVGISGPGGVVSSPGGISCGTRCRAAYDFGTQVRLHADADRHSSFVGWGGDPDCVDGLVTLDADKTCRASFVEVPPLPCFIATAAYGSYLESEVQVLRDFRNRYLLTNDLGRAINRLYLRYSPPIAAAIQGNPALRTLTRGALTPIIYGLKYPAASGMILFLLTGWVVYRRAYRRRS